jgi:hypothetical protein
LFEWAIGEGAIHQSMVEKSLIFGGSVDDLLHRHRANACAGR